MVLAPSNRSRIVITALTATFDCGLVFLFSCDAVCSCESEKSASPKLLYRMAAMRTALALLASDCCWLLNIFLHPPKAVIYLFIYYEWPYNTYIVQEESANKVIIKNTTTQNAKSSHTHIILPLYIQLYSHIICSTKILWKKISISSQTQFNTLCVCMFVSRITQKVVDKFRCIFGRVECVTSKGWLDFGGNPDRDAVTVPVWAQNSSLQTRLHMTFTSENYWGVNLLTYLLYFFKGIFTIAG